MAENQLSQTDSVALAMDLGGTWIRAALVTQAGNIIWQERTPTNPGDAKEAIVGRINDAISRGLSAAQDNTLAGVGLALAGPVDPRTGILYAPPNLLQLDGVSFKNIWQERGKWPVFTGNDATVAALGEYTYGSGVGSRTLIYITLSTGIGGGIVVDGRPMDGAYGMAGEIGHMCIDRNGPLCKCGHRGCLESYASGTAIGETAQRLVKARTDSMLVNMVSGDLSKISAQHVFQAARAGDVVSQELLDDVSQALGVGLVNILHLFNPDIIVIGGGVSQSWDCLWPTVDRYIQTNAMAHIRKMGFQVVVTSLGDDIGLLGAAAMVWSGQQ